MIRPDTKIRRYTESDINKLAKVYRESVQELGRGHYNPEQLRVWASFADEAEDFRNLLESGFTIVAEQAGRSVAFGALQPVDRVALLYTLKSHSRIGVATAIYRELESYSASAGVKIIHTEASIVSRPFFLKMGFEVAENEIAFRNGLPFKRFKMLKNLSG